LKRRREERIEIEIYPITVTNTMNKQEIKGDVLFGLIISKILF